MFVQYKNIYNVHQSRCFFNSEYDKYVVQVPHSKKLYDLT